MSLLIKDMKMPKSCEKCQFFVWSLGVGQHCAVASNITFHAIIDGMDVSYECNGDCPLIELPPHGDLIDRDAFLAEKRHLYCENCARRKGMKNGKMKFVYGIGDAPCRACGYGDVLDNIEDAPTIIESEEEDG